MIKKYNDRPLWYKLWTFSVIIALVYSGIKILFFDPSSLDYLLQVYGFFSYLIDYFFISKPHQVQKES